MDWPSKKLSLKKIISCNSVNKYNLWPGVTMNQITSLELYQIINDEKSNKSFFFEKNSKCYLYFQLQYLEWDSNHFGYKCGIIKHFFIDDGMSFLEIEETVKKIEPVFFHYLRQNNYAFIFADICSQSKNGNYFVQLLKFQFILNWVDGFWITKNEINLNNNISVSELRDEELEAICSIASRYYYKGGRFYSDKRFDNVKVDNLYGSVVRSSHQSGDIIRVLRENDLPVGVFVINKITEYKTFGNLKVAHLRFLVVDENHRGLNAGYNIFTSTLDYLRNRCDIIVTGLESHNLISLNLHIKLGFKFNYFHNAYHLWLT